MTSRATRGRCWRAALVAAALCAPASTTMRAGAASAADPRVRSAHPYLRAMIAEAQVRSATFRRLVSAIEATDGIVFVEEGDCRHGVHACLVPVITLAGGSRMLQVLVDARQPDWEVMASMGHELQHALDVLSDAHIRTEVQMYFHFLGKGYGGGGEPLETPDAVRAGNAVRNEVGDFAKHHANLGAPRTSVGPLK